MYIEFRDSDIILQAFIGAGFSLREFGKIYQRRLKPAPTGFGEKIFIQQSNFFFGLDQIIIHIIVAFLHRTEAKLRIVKYEALILNLAINI